MNFKQKIISAIVGLLSLGGVAVHYNVPEAVLGATVCFPYQGCTGTATVPTTGQLLVGNSGGTYTVTSTVPGLVFSGTTTFSNIASSSILYTQANGQVTGSSTLLSFNGSQLTTSNTLFSNATTTNLGITGLTKLGTITYAGASNSYVNDVNLPIQIIGSAAQYGVSRTANTYGLLIGVFNGTTYGIRSIQSGDSLSFIVNNTTQALTISPTAGNVGISEVSPLARLSVGPGSLSDGNTQIQISTGAAGTQTNIGVNRNGGYGFLLGYLNNVNFGGYNNYLGGYLRNVNVDDSFAIAVNSSKFSMVWNSATDVGIGGTITNSTTFSGASMVVKGTGNVGIASSSPNYRLTVSGTVAFANLNSSITGNGICRTTTGEITDAGAAACIPSALRFKENINPFTDNALAAIAKLNVITFQYKTGVREEHKNESKERIGLIAEEVQKVDNRLVAYDKDGKLLTLNFEEITALQTKAIQEQQAQIAGLQEQISQLKHSVGIIEHIFNKLKQLFS